MGSELKPTETGNLVGEMTDADMMEAEPPPPQVFGPNQATADVWKNLLICIRKLIDQGKPSQALRMLVMTMREHSGEAAVTQIMRRAREIYHNKVHAMAVEDELASLFAECAIAEKRLPSKDEPSIEPPSMVYTEPDEYGKSILNQTGRKQVMLDAFSDGSSFVCSRCGGLVSILRKDEHNAYWCCKGV